MAMLLDVVNERVVLLLITLRRERLKYRRLSPAGTLIYFVFDVLIQLPVLLFQLHVRSGGELRSVTLVIRLGQIEIAVPAGKPLARHVGLGPLLLIRISGKRTYLPPFQGQVLQLRNVPTRVPARQQWRALLFAE